MGVSRRWMVVTVALTFGGCQCGKKGTTSLLDDIGIPKAPAQLNFGNVAVGQSIRLPLVLDNVGTSPLNVTSQAVSGSPFSETSPFISNAIPASGKTQAVIGFAPTASGPVSGTFTIGDDGDPTQVKVALVGTGLALDVSATPAALSFGQVPVGVTPAPTQTVAIENTAATSVYVAISTSGTASEYTVTDSSGNAVTSTPVELAPNTPYVLTVAFEPDTASIFNSAFTFMPCETASTSACLAPQPVTLGGQGVSGQITLSPNPIAFNNVPEGSTATQTITVANVGTAAATVSCLSFQSLGSAGCGTATAAFTLGTPSQTLPATLMAGDSFTVPLTYASSSTTAVTDVLVATYTAQGQAQPATAVDDIQASESAAPCTITLAPASLNLTYATAGTPVTGTVTLTNTGGTVCQLSSIALDAASDPGFTLPSTQATSETVAVGGTNTISVSFNLAANTPPSTRLGHLDFQSTDPAHATVQVPLVASLVSPYAGGGSWPRWHHDNIQSGLSQSDTSWLKGTIAWTFNVSLPPVNPYTNAPTDYMNSPVVGVDGTVYQLGMNGTVYAINPDGGLQWQTPLEGPVLDPHPGTPIIANDGSLFIAFGDTTQGSLTYGLYHLSAAGAPLAEIAPIGESDGFDLPPALTNGGLLLGADDAASPNGGGAGAFAFQINTDGTFNAVDNTTISSVFDQISAVVGADDTTYWCTGGSCDSLSPPDAGFAENGGWPISPNETDSATSDLALDEAFTGNLMILLGGWTSGGGSEAQQVVSVVPRTGVIAWTAHLPPPTPAQENPTYIGFADGTVGNSCPAIGTDGTVYVGNFDGLHALVGATGVEKAGFPFLTNQSVVLTAPAIGGDGTIFFGTADGSFYAVHPDGTLRFKVSASGRVAGSPAIGPTGVVYFVADDGLLYAVN